MATPAASLPSREAKCARESENSAEKSHIRIRKYVPSTQVGSFLQYFNDNVPKVRARAPNGSQEVAARVRGGHVTARTRIGVQLGRLIDTVRRSRKEAG